MGFKDPEGCIEEGSRPRVPPGPVVIVPDDAPLERSDPAHPGIGEGGGRVARPWVLTILVASIVDVAGRFALSFDMPRVHVMEAVLFPLSGIVLWVFLSRGARQQGWRRGLQVWTVAGCFLAGLRVGLWALGVPVSRANLVIIVLPALVVVVWWAVRLARGERKGTGPVA